MRQPVNIHIALYEAAFASKVELERYVDELTRCVVQAYPNSETLIDVEAAHDGEGLKEVACVSAWLEDDHVPEVAEVVGVLCLELYEDGAWREGRGAL